MNIKSAKYEHEDLSQVYFKCKRKGNRNNQQRRNRIMDNLTFISIFAFLASVLICAALWLLDLAYLKLKALFIIISGKLKKPRQMAVMTSKIKREQ